MRNPDGGQIPSPSARSRYGSTLWVNFCLSQCHANVPNSWSLGHVQWSHQSRVDHLNEAAEELGYSPSRLEFRHSSDWKTNCEKGVCLAASDRKNMQMILQLDLHNTRQSRELWNFRWQGSYWWNCKLLPWHESWCDEKWGIYLWFHSIQPRTLWDCWGSIYLRRETLRNRYC